MVNLTSKVDRYLLTEVRYEITFIQPEATLVSFPIFGEKMEIF